MKHSRTRRSSSRSSATGGASAASAWVARAVPSTARSAAGAPPIPDRTALLARCRAACVKLAEAGGDYNLFDAETLSRYLARTTQLLFRKWPDQCTNGELWRMSRDLEQHAAARAAALRTHAQAVTAAHQAWLAARHTPAPRLPAG